MTTQRYHILRDGKLVRVARNPFSGTMEELTERNAAIVRRRAEAVPYDQIGTEFGLTRERVRQIIARASKEAK